jgi:hypothetical protein
MEVGARGHADQRGRGATREPDKAHADRAWLEPLSLLPPPARASGKTVRGVQDQLRQSSYIYDTVVGDFVGKVDHVLSMILKLRWNIIQTGGEGTDQYCP